MSFLIYFFFFSSRRRHTRCSRDWSSDVCSSDLCTRPGRRVPRDGTIAAHPPTEDPMSQDLLEALKDGVAVLTLNRPDRLNAMSPSMLDALLEALPRLAADPEVGVVVLTGAGRAFCAGGDVKAMAEGREFGGTTLEDKAQALRSRMEVSRWLHEMPKPTIAMVRGAAAGAGLSLALACDLRVAGDTARFATAFARVGYSGDFGGSWFLTQLVGTAKARELYFTADVVDAREARELRSEEHTSELQSRLHLVCRLLLEKKNIISDLSI